MQPFHKRKAALNHGPHPRTAVRGFQGACWWCAGGVLVLVGGVSGCVHGALYLDTLRSRSRRLAMSSESNFPSNANIASNAWRNLPEAVNNTLPKPTSATAFEGWYRELYVLTKQFVEENPGYSRVHYLNKYLRQYEGKAAESHQQVYVSPKRWP